MPTINFHKYQGTGNDFIFVDNRNNIFPTTNDLIKRLCDRKFGIGADGIVLLQDHQKCDFEMVYYNPDASQSFCGNASRCAVHFAESLNMISGKAEFMAFDGLHHAYIKNGLIHLKMSDVTRIDRLGENFFVETGSPHYISFVDDLETLDVFQEGRKIRYSPAYREKGVNVNFVRFLSGNEIFVRTYERGVENETLSCGTGATAAALAASFKGAISPLKIKTRGGDLQIMFRKAGDSNFTDIYLVGPATKVYAGEIEV